MYYIATVFAGSGSCVESNQLESLMEAYDFITSVLVQYNGTSYDWWIEQYDGKKYITIVDAMDNKI